MRVGREGGGGYAAAAEAVALSSSQLLMELLVLLVTTTTTWVLLAAPVDCSEEHGDRGLLGGACHLRGRCDVAHARCQQGVCVCPESFISSTSRRRCLPVSERLGETCDEDAQCVVKHATCRRRTRVCDCRRGHVAAGPALCLEEVSLGDACEDPAQCTGLTECSADGRCVCRGIAFEADGQCVTDAEGGARDWGPPPLDSGGSTFVVKCDVFACVVLTVLLSRVRL